MESDSLELIVADGRYLSIVGTWIDDIGKNGTPKNLPPAFHDNRVKRDKSERYHITLVSAPEIATLLTGYGLDKKHTNKQLHRMVKFLMTKFGNPAKDWEQPVDYGLGRLTREVSTEQQQRQHNSKHKPWRKCNRVTHINETQATTTTTTTTEAAMVEMSAVLTSTTAKTSIATAETPLVQEGCYYRLIHWPFGQRLRRALGLHASHFHITIGFHPIDIHAPKSVDTLVLDQDEDPAVMRRLVKAAVYYPDKVNFLRKLYQYLEMSGQLHLAEPWAHYVSEARMMIRTPISENTTTTKENGTDSPTETSV